MGGKVKKEKNILENEQHMKEAIPPHILNMVKNVEEKRKNRKKEQTSKKQQSLDSIALIRNMMSSVRTKYELSEAAEEVRKDKEQDIKMITNARDIFKNLETEPEDLSLNLTKQKVKRVEVKPDFILTGQNKAEEIRKERIKEMNAMKVARERQMEDDERYRIQEKNKADEARKQREIEMEMMRLARQQVLEEEERNRVNEDRSKFVREISPGIIAAKQSFNIEPRNVTEEDKMQQLRNERNRELNEMKMARALEMEKHQEIENRHQQKSESIKELEALRKSQHAKVNFQESSTKTNCLEPKRASKPKRFISDNWMKNEEFDKINDMKRERELELEAMLTARNSLFEEEEKERLEFEAQKREETEKRAKEMAVLVSELQQIKNRINNEAESKQEMTRYQEEMMQRIMELHAISHGGLFSSQ